MLIRAIAFLSLKTLILYIVSSLNEKIKEISRSVPKATSRSAVSGNSQGKTITVPKTGGQKVKGVYVQQIVELLNLEEWIDEDTEPEQPAD